MTSGNAFHSDIRASFAAAFANWRVKNRVPLKQIAVDLGVTVATVSMWGSGKRFPNDRHVDKIANYTGIPPCRLVCMMADHCASAKCRPTLAAGDR